MPSEITATFEFEIGDLVYIKGAPHSSDARPRMFVVIERLAQQCHAGIQRLYRMEGYSNGQIGVPEVALTKEEPPYRLPTIEACLEQYSMTENHRRAREVFSATLGKEDES